MDGKRYASTIEVSIADVSSVLFVICVLRFAKYALIFSTS